MIRDAARDFAQSELLPGVIERDENQSFPTEQVKKLGELGFLGMMVDPKYGGAGMDTISYVLAMEEISKIDGSVCQSPPITIYANTMPITLGTACLVELPSNAQIGQSSNFPLNPSTTFVLLLIFWVGTYPSSHIYSSFDFADLKQCLLVLVFIVMG